MCLRGAFTQCNCLLVDTNFKENGVVPKVVLLLQMLVRDEDILTLLMRVLAGLGNDGLCRVVGL